MPTIPLTSLTQISAPAQTGDAARAKMMTDFEAASSREAGDLPETRRSPSRPLSPLAGLQTTFDFLGQLRPAQRNLTGPLACPSAKDFHPSESGLSISPVQSLPGVPLRAFQMGTLIQNSRPEDAPAPLAQFVTAL